MVEGRRRGSDASEERSKKRRDSCGPMAAASQSERMEERFGRATITGDGEMEGEGGEKGEGEGDTQACMGAAGANRTGESDVRWGKLVVLTADCAGSV